jgi:hypothetical protein
VKGARLALVLVCAAACGRSSSSEGLASSAGAGASQSAGIAPSAPSAPAASSAAASGHRSWHGSYSSAVGALNLPPERAKGRPADADPSAGVGAGTLALTDDGGRVTGTIDGVLGPAVVDGVIAGDQLSATVVRKDPTDRGFAGMLAGKVSGDHGDGTMTLSSGQASSIRTATFTLSSDPSH